MDCRACVKVCPVNIDIRKGLNAACINCAECIDTCSGKMEKKQKPGLIGYFFGSPGNRRNLLRTSTLLIGAVTLLFFLFFLYLSFTRNPINLTLLPNNAFKPRITEQGELLNSYIMAIENKSSHDIEFMSGASLQGKKLRLLPDRIMMKAGEYRRVTAYLFAQQKEKGSVELTLESIKPVSARISRSVTITYPPEVK